MRMLRTAAPALSTLTKRADDMTNNTTMTTCAIEQAWKRIKDAREAWNRAADDDDDAERQHWAIVDPAEALISSTAATSLRAAEIKLWIALLHTVDDRDDDRAVVTENVATLTALESGFDFIPRLIFATIRDLRAMRGV